MDRGRESFLRSWSIATNHIALTPRRVPCQQGGGNKMDRCVVYYISYVYVRKAGYHHISAGDQHKYFQKSLIVSTSKNSKITWHFQNHDVMTRGVFSSRWDTVYRFGVGLIIKDEAFWQSLWFKRFPLNEKLSVIVSQFEIAAGDPIVARPPRTFI